MPAYVERSDPSHIYQGDVFETVTVMVPRTGGALDTLVAPAIIVSHDCEYTKYADEPDQHLLVAPLRNLAAWADGGQDGLIRAGRVHALWLLPSEDPIDRDLVADLRFTQPITIEELQAATHWATLGPDAKATWQGKIARFLFRGDF